MQLKPSESVDDISANLVSIISKLDIESLNKLTSVVIKKMRSIYVHEGGYSPGAESITEFDNYRYKTLDFLENVLFIISEKTGK